MNSGFQWVVSPDVIAKGLDDYGQKALVANYWGSQEGYNTPK